MWKAFAVVVVVADGCRDSRSDAEQITVPPVQPDAEAISPEPTGPCEHRVYARFGLMHPPEAGVWVRCFNASNLIGEMRGIPDSIAVRGRLWRHMGKSFVGDVPIEFAPGAVETCEGDAVVAGTVNYPHEEFVSVEEATPRLIDARVVMLSPSDEDTVSCVPVPLVSEAAAAALPDPDECRSDRDIIWRIELFLMPSGKVGGLHVEEPKEVNERDRRCVEAHFLALAVPPFSGHSVGRTKYFMLHGNRVGRPEGGVRIDGRGGS